jgi:polysaccharide export outer membrane protein
MKTPSIKLSFVILLVLFTGLFFSCVPQKKIKYLQDSSDTKPSNVIDNKVKDYRIQPGDYLYIRLFTMDKDANTIYSEMSGGSGNTSLYEQNIYLTSYLVSDSGYINFPLLGKIPAQGKLVSEIEEHIRGLMLKEVNNAGVVVRLANFKVSILGEVQNPGTYIVNQHRVTIFQALALASDLTTYSNRNSVKLLRKQGAQTLIVNLDLTKKDIISSEYYYLLPGDILYVEPLKYKQYAFESFPYALILSSLSTMLALITFFKI